jgi:HK97 family phage major capsid protein
MPGDESIASQDALNKFVAETRRALQDAGGKLGQIDKVVEDLKEIRQAQTLERIERGQHRPDGTDDAVTRAYVASEKAVGPAEVASLDGHLRYADDAHSQNVSYVGKQGVGVVRMIGSEELGGHYEYGLLDDPKPKTDWQKHLQRLVEARSFARRLKGRSPRIDREIMRHLSRGPSAIARVFADNTGEGAEFIPDVVMPQLQRELELARQVEALFPRMSIPTGGSTVNPFHSVGCQPFVHGVPTTGDLNPAELEKSVPTTSSGSVNPATLTVSLPADKDATEDAIVQWDAYARLNLVEAIRDGIEDAIINGDTAATHGDSGLASWNPRSRWNTLGSSNDHRKAWIGLRHRAIDVSSSSSGNAAQTVAGAMAWLADLDSPHAFGSVVYITSPEYFLVKLLTDSNVLTVDKYGPFASILTGEVGRIGGRPVVLSEFMDKQLNTSGVYDNSTKTKTAMCIVNRDRFVMADRRGLMLETETVARRHTVYFVASIRTKFHTFDSATKKNVAYRYNLDVS